jgi:hypothetical protein
VRLNGVLGTTKQKRKPIIGFRLLFLSFGLEGQFWFYCFVRMYILVEEVLLIGAQEVASVASSDSSKVTPAPAVMVPVTAWSCPALGPP